MLDVCGCCEVCARRLSQLCDLPDEPVKYGSCGEYLSCKPRTDIRVILATNSLLLL